MKLFQGSNLLLALLLSSRIVAVSPYYWDTANSGNVNTDQITNDQSLLTQTRFGAMFIDTYNYINYTISIAVIRPV